MPNRISAGVGERMQHLAHKFNDTTIRFILHYPGFLDPDRLCAATKAIIERVDVLHSSFISSSLSCHWRINKTYQTEDFFSLYECNGDPLKIASGLALQAVDYKDACQMQVILVQGSNSCAVVLRISHLVVDGGDGKYLLNKLAEAYRILEQSQNAETQEIKNGSRSAMNAYNDLGIRELFSLAKPPFSGVKTSFPFRHPTNTAPHACSAAPFLPNC